ncbi:MAG: AbrB/MazE/SpoVT family DNA-binding domain-containing protein [Paucimonas sp.]|jgi:antitoxin component of MazEF toxin-antitoxin module|nr:AbrB/MazE/SpoVT family DNA-binding domain-containing protein [Paucimonas sp.]
MRTQIRKVGNSAGVVIPALMLKEAHAEIGTIIELTVKEGVFLAKPILNSRKRVARSSVTLESLIKGYVRFEEEIFSIPTSREVIEDGDSPGSEKRGHP